MEFLGAVDFPANVKNKVKVLAYNGTKLITTVKSYVTMALKSFDLPGNTRGGCITVLLTSCLTGLESAV